MPNQIPDLNREILIFDGAMGTMLQKSGALKPGSSPDLLNLTRPEVVASIHAEYLKAGSGCIQTNTFGGNRLKLERLGLESKAGEINVAGVIIAQEMAAGKALVAASLGPTGKMIEPLGDLSFAVAYQTFLEQCRFFAEAKADLINIETMTDIQEAKAAIMAALEVRLPVMVSVSFMENGRMLNGFTPEMVAASLSGFPLLALGTNCGLSASALIPIVQKLIAYAQKPLIVKPNAGRPSLMGNETVYRENAAEFAAACLELVKNGVRVIGGCCGTSPEYIKLLADTLQNNPVSHQPIKVDDYLTGKNTMIPGSVPISKSEVWEIKLEPKNGFWNEFCRGNIDPVIDTILNLDPGQNKVMEINGLSLGDSDLDCFQKLIQVLTTYWPNPINASLSSANLIRVFLTNCPGRSVVTADPDNAGLVRAIKTCGGIFRPII
jgi:methionine synthase I (cobalamin-dependent)